MIKPEDKVPLDDTQKEEADDQQSQKDIHSNGFDEEINESENVGPDLDLLNQAYNAAESAYTLDPDKKIAPRKNDTDENGGNPSKNR